MSGSYMARRWFSLSPLAGRGDRVAPAVVAGPAMNAPLRPDKLGTIVQPILARKLDPRALASRPPLH